MRLAYVTEMFPFGEGETFLEAEVNWLASHGHQVLIVPTFPKGEQRPLPANVGCVLPHPQGTLNLHDRLRTRAPGGRAGKTRRLNRIAAAGARSVAPDVASWRPDFIFCHWLNFTATLGMVLSREIGVPWGVTAHRYDIAANNLLAEKMRSACLVRFISRNGQAMAKALAGSPTPTGVVIAMGVDLPDVRMPDPQQEFSTETPFVFFAPARLVPVKGHQVLLNAFATLSQELPEAQLWLAGAGPEEGRLRGLCETLGLSDRVRFLGHLPHEQILASFRDGFVQCVVVPSLDLGGGLHEGIPVAFMEAMAHAIPVIGTRAGGVPELLDRGGGILVPPNDPQTLATAMRRICLDHVFRVRLGLEAREVIKEGFCLDVVMPRLMRNLAEACTEGGHPQ